MKHEDSAEPIAKEHLGNPCRHGVKGLCCKCQYGERSHYQSKKGMTVERDCVDFIRFNKNLLSGQE